MFKNSLKTVLKNYVNISISNYKRDITACLTAGGHKFESCNSHETKSRRIAAFFMPYYFYIIFSEELDKFYYGHTNEFDNRVRKHNTNHKGFTGKANDWALVYYEIFETKSEAYARERQVKGWKNTERIKQLIRKGSEHPD